MLCCAVPCLISRLSLPSGEWSSSDPVDRDRPRSRVEDSKIEKVRWLSYGRAGKVGKASMIYCTVRERQRDRTLIH